MTRRAWRRVVWALEDAPRWARVTLAVLCCVVAGGEALLGGVAWAWVPPNLAAAGGLLYADHRAAARARDLEAVLRVVLHRDERDGRWMA